MQTKNLGALIMERAKERRKEQRLHCHWSLWFTEGLGKTLYQGQVLDISSEGVAFTCPPGKNFPHPGQKVVTHFSVPRFGSDDASDMTIFNRSSCIYRVDTIDESLYRVAVRFDEPLPFKPSKFEAANLMLHKDTTP